MSPTLTRALYLFHTETPNQNSENESTRQNRLSELFQIRFIRCTDRISGILISIIGLMTSLWADCILVVICTQDYARFANMDLFIEKTIIHTSQLSHFLIVITGTAGLLYGIKVKNKAYLTPWIFTKLTELTVLLLGIIFLATGTRRYIGIIPFGICFLITGLYITLCVWSTYKNEYMDNEESRDILEDVMVNSSCPIRDAPPSYDSYDVQVRPNRPGLLEGEWR